MALQTVRSLSCPLMSGAHRYLCLVLQYSLLPGKSHGRRRLVGYSPWGRKESDTTERLH